MLVPHSRTAKTKCFTVRYQEEPFLVLANSPQGLIATYQSFCVIFTFKAEKGEAGSHM